MTFFEDFCTKVSKMHASLLSEASMESERILSATSHNLVNAALYDPDWRRPLPNAANDELNLQTFPNYNITLCSL